MKCPHCTTDIFYSSNSYQVGNDSEGHYSVKSGQCPKCHKLILSLCTGKQLNNANYLTTIDEFFIRPKVSNRNPIPVEVPREFANDYKEACLVLSDSPKSSAALSRRCLQHILREVAKVKKGDLYNEIQEVIDSRKLPSYLTEQLDSIRHVGNIAAHTTKSKSTGEIVDVEPHEAEWNLDVLELVFDFYFVQPSIAQQRREALNKKLTDAGKSVMK